MKDKNEFIYNINVFSFKIKKFNIIKNEGTVWDLNTTFSSFSKDYIVIIDGFYLILLVLLIFLTLMKKTM